VAEQLGALNPAIDPAKWSSQRFDGRNAGGRMVGLDDRRQRFARVAALAQSVGIRVHACRCKNPELGGCGCDIAGPHDVAAPPHAQQTFGFSTCEAPPPARARSTRPPTDTGVQIDPEKSV
jgi:hypothetical protein